MRNVLSLHGANAITSRPFSCVKNVHLLPSLNRRKKFKQGRSSECVCQNTKFLLNHVCLIIYIFMQRQETSLRIRAIEPLESPITRRNLCIKLLLYHIFKSFKIFTMSITQIHLSSLYFKVTYLPQIQTS